LQRSGQELVGRVEVLGEKESLDAIDRDSERPIGQAEGSRIERFHRRKQWIEAVLQAGQ